MMYLPRLCEHCLNPTCVASLPLGLDLQARGRRHRADRPGQVPRLAHVRVGLPVQEDLLQLEERQGREVHLLLPAHRGRPADRVHARPASAASATSACCCTTPTASSEAASVEHDRDLYQAQLDIFLDPNDPAVIAQARARRHPRRLDGSRARQPGLQDGGGMEGGAAAAPRVPHAADGLVRAAAVADHAPRPTPGTSARTARFPTSAQLRIPVKYLANLLTAGDTAPVVRALERMLAMRAYQREQARRQARSTRRCSSRSA